MSCTPNETTAPNFLTHFQAVEDLRQVGKVRYPLEEIRNYSGSTKNVDTTIFSLSYSF